MTNRILLALALLAGSAVMHAQSSVSPYTLFGAGAADSGVHGWNAGMAGLGTGIRADNMLNPSNPASLSSLQRKSFIMDIIVIVQHLHPYGQYGHHFGLRQSPSRH